MPNLDSGARACGYRATLNAIFPDAANTIITAFVDKQGMLMSVGVNQTRPWLAYLFANVHHELEGSTRTTRRSKFSRKVSSARMVEVGPTVSIRAVRPSTAQRPAGSTKPSTTSMATAWLGTGDGSTYIGRGGRQVTGRDGYEQVGRRIGVDLVNNPARACDRNLQPRHLRGTNPLAEAGNFIDCVKIWNGGTNGRSQLARITKILQGAEWGGRAIPAARVRAAGRALS